MSLFPSELPLLKTPKKMTTENTYILRGLGFFASFRGLGCKLNQVGFSKASIFGDLAIAEVLAKKHGLKVITITPEMSDGHDVMALGVNAQC